MTKAELAEMLMKFAKEYCNEETLGESIDRNSHMNQFNGHADPELIKAVVVDYVNFVMYKQGVDLGFYTKDLE